MGRRTYEGFAEAWPKVTDPDDAVATALNGLPKHVVSTTLRDAPWGPAEIVRGGEVEARVGALREAPGREVQVHGSTTLARSLLAAGLVDELRLVIAPVVVGPAGGCSRPTARPPGSRCWVRDDAGRARDPRVRGRGPARDGDLQEAGARYVIEYSGPLPPSGGVRRPPLAVIAPHCTQLEGLILTVTVPFCGASSSSS